MPPLAKVIPLVRNGGSQRSEARGNDSGSAETEPPGSPRSMAGLEAEVVSRAQAGDVAAQGEFFKRAWPLVHGLVYRLLPADPERDDIAQDVFVVALDRLRGLREPSAWTFWLRGITVRVVRRKLRTRRLLRRLGLYSPTVIGGEDSLLSTGTPPEVEAELRELLAALAKLEDEERLLLSLRHIEEWSLPEVAAHLGVSLSTAKRRYGAASEKLQKLVSPELLSVRHARIAADGGYA